MLNLYFYSWILRLFKNAKARGLDQGANQWWLPRVGAYTRAHPWDFALFAFTSFTERDQKNVGVFLENVQRFSFFLRRFLKNVGRFYELLPTFLKVAAVCRQTGCLESHFFLFSVEKKASFQHSCVKVVKAKKRKSLGTRPRITCARERVKR